MRFTSLRRGAAGSFAALLLMLVGPSCQALTTAPSVHATMPVYGWVEWAYIEPQHVHLKAKLDSGAKTSSLSAIDVERFERDGAVWMRFRVPISASDGGTAEPQLIAMESRLDKEVLIKRHGSGPSRRPVVPVAVCLGGQVFMTPVTLTDRSHFNYPLLLGRSALRSRALLDVSRVYINGADAASCAAGARDSKD